MTPEERIAQLAGVRGGVATYPRPPRPSPEPERQEARRPTGFDVTLSQSWQKVNDNWDNRERRQRLMNLETVLAAGVIARYLGDGWRREVTGEDRCERISVIHRDGYGFRFSRSWQDGGRFVSSAIHQHKRNEPPSITTSAGRTLGAIAGDIQRRLIDNGLHEAYQEQQQADESERTERRQKFDQLRAVVQAWGGRILGRRSWQNDDHPLAEIPGGVAKIGYGFNGLPIEIELTLTESQAVSLGEAFTRGV